MHNRTIPHAALLGALLLNTLLLPAISHAAGPASADNRYPMAADLAQRNADIHWPAGFSPAEADLFAHNETDIDASCAIVWRHIAAAGDWSQWYPNGTHVTLPAGTKALEARTVFQWRTFGFDLESKIVEFEPIKRMGWFGYTPGKTPNFYHTWYLQPSSDGCHVVTEEVGRGPDARSFRQADEATLHRGHDLWLAGLKWVSENAPAVTGLP